MFCTFGGIGIKRQRRKLRELRELDEYWARTKSERKEKRKIK